MAVGRCSYPQRQRGGRPPPPLCMSSNAAVFFRPILRFLAMRFAHRGLFSPRDLTSNRFCRAGRAEAEACEALRWAATAEEEGEERWAAARAASDAAAAREAAASQLQALTKCVVYISGKEACS